jgi:hypothetical protein
VDRQASGLVALRDAVIKGLTRLVPNAEDCRHLLESGRPGSTCLDRLVSFWEVNIVLDHWGGGFKGRGRERGKREKGKRRGRERERARGPGARGKDWIDEKSERDAQTV